MNTLLIIGTRVVVLALISYSVAILTEQRKHAATNMVLLFLTLGVVLDITATVFMILGSPHSPFTMHGYLGYSALLAMLVDFYLLWRLRLDNGKNAEAPKGVHLYSRYAYIWWVVAFITGSLMVIFK